jgi:branched-chain amino acid transport system substrate-binding protein
MYLTATLALGAPDDPTCQLYQAVMSAYGDEVGDVENVTAMGGYAAMASLATALEGMTGDITPQSVIAAIKAMPEHDVPGGGGVRFPCGGTAVAAQPAVCAKGSLRTRLDGEGQPTTYEAIDATEIMAGL